jgi:very-short-patch-repair endonuclease
MQNSFLPEMFYGANRDIFQKAEYLRAHMTLAELTLWERLNKSQLNYRFKAQHPIDIFIVDFYCHKCKLVIELDGEIHLSRKEYDEGRTAELERFGLKVIRFSNNEVLTNIENVITEIKENLKVRGEQ